MKTKKINFKPIFKYLLLFFICIVLAQAKIGELSPFLFAFFFACLFVYLDEKIIAGATLIGSMFSNWTFENFLVTITVIAVGLILVYVHKLAKHRLNLFTILCGFLISCTTYIYYNYTQIKSLILFLLLGLICVFAYITILQVLILRKNCFKLTLDESICFMFGVATIGLGLAPVYIFNLSLARFLIATVVLFCVSIGSPALTYSVVVSFTLGCALREVSLVVVAEFIIVTLLASIFSMPSKFKIMFITVIGDILIQYFFVTNSEQLIYSVLPIAIAAVIFVLTPNRLINSLSDIVYVKKSEMSSRNLINTTRKNIKKRMVELSNVFLDMKQIHLNMTKKELTKEELISMLTREILSSSCKECLDKNRCTRSLGTDNKSNLELLVEIAINKGKVTFLDVPDSLSNRCGKVNQLLSMVNRMIDEYRQYKNMMTDVNNVKILMADQMGAVSRLLLDVGEEIDTNVRFDIAREDKIISRLLNLNIQCKEVLLYSEKNDEMSAVLVVKNEHAYNPSVEKVVTETLKIPMQITKITQLEESGYTSVQLRKKNKYDCVFGLASCNKSGNVECGDCHSIIRLGANKFLLALCDGMGAGKNAHKMSAMTLGLIENFYKVGFDNDVILDSVNKLLAINNQENYSTLDVCLLDLEKDIADFIKVGAPFGLIRRDSSIEVVEGGALPIGALDNITPSTLKTTISTKDIIIMSTDGVIDMFETPENMIEFVSHLATNNPQTLADAILNEALNLGNMSAKDDMTVLVARTYLK